MAQSDGRDGCDANPRLSPKGTLSIGTPERAFLVGDWVFQVNENGYRMTPVPVRIASVVFRQGEPWFGFEESNTRLPADQLEVAPTVDAAGPGLPTSAVVGVVGSSFTTPEYQLLDSASAVEVALPELLSASIIGLDLETTGLDPHRDRVRLVQLATPKRTYLVDANRADPRLLRPLLEAPSVKVLNNGKFDLRFLLSLGLTVGSVVDTLLADQLLRCTGEHTKPGHVPRSLADLAAEYLDVKLDKDEQKGDWSGELSESQLAYAARDAAVLLPLKAVLDERIDGAGLGRCLKLENRALPAVVWLEHSGAPFSAEAWRELADSALGEKLGLEKELTALARADLGDNTLFGRRVNWGAPNQVIDVLSALGFPVPNTTEDTLAGLVNSHPIVEKLLAYRDVSKRVGTYGLNVLGDVNSRTGRIHADWRQIGSDAGRMSCTRPNLQNVPRTPAYRACFQAPEGRVLVKADYSQVELRIAAERAGDARMLNAYSRGEDLHTLTARTILGKLDVSKEDRQLAKSANFGLLYGMGAERFRDYAQSGFGVTLSLDEAAALRDGFFRAYPGLRAWHRSQPNEAVDTRTTCGRRRLKVGRFTEKLNTPVQGTGADGLKAALALLWETRGRVPSAYPVLAVHDEIVVECDEHDAWFAREWLTECMTRGMGVFLKRVPVVVEAAVARDWSLRSPLEVVPPEGVYLGDVPEEEGTRCAS